MFDAKIEIYCKQSCSLTLNQTWTPAHSKLHFHPIWGIVPPLFQLYFCVWPVEHCNEKLTTLVKTFFHPTIEQFHMIPCHLAGVSFYLPTNL